MPHPNSIRLIGLNRYLEQTRDKHNGRGYAEFVKYIEYGDEFGEPLPFLKMARVFKVTRQTLERWITIYNEEQRKAVSTER